jgi:hypothetical protein
MKLMASYRSVSSVSPTKNLFKLAILYRTMSDALFIDMIKQMRNDLQKREQRVLRKNENKKGHSK